MALFFHDDTDMSHRQTGFARYRQLLSFYASRWIKINLITLAGYLPLTAAIVISILSSSILVLFPSAIIAGLISGPFTAGLFDSVMRGLRDAPGQWTDHYRKSWHQNLRGSLMPGALSGVFIGTEAFMIHIMWNSGSIISTGTIVLMLFSTILFLMFSNVYWPQLVLFRQTASIRMANSVLFISKHLWKMAGVTILQIIYIALYVLFSPWTLILIPFIGYWYIVFVSELLIYKDLDKDLSIEQSFIPVEGDPWDDSSEIGSVEEF